MNYKFDSIVSKQDQTALKNIIFNRAKEHSKSMTDDVQSNVMDLARESFVSQNNPFSQIAEYQQQANSVTEEVSISNNIEKAAQQEPAEGIGFPQKELKARAVEQSRIVQEQITSYTVKSTMAEAREKLSNKKSFMGALNFLNSQAAVSLMRTNTENFEVIA